jgi:hypothetical protein
MRRAFSGLAGLSMAALPFLTFSGAQAADLTYAAPARTLTVQRVAADCPLLPTVVARGRRGVGEPGTFYAYWDWAPVCPRYVVIGR